MLLVSAAAFAQKQVVAVGLFEGAALLRVNGLQRLVRSGDTFEGVLVEEADPHSVVVSQAGVKEELTLSGHIATSFTPPTRRQWSIPANSQRQYITSVTINGRRTMGMIDTGANVVAMSSQTAERIGLDYQELGREGVATTASGQVKAWHFKLERLNVGGLDTGYLDTTVIEGAYPEMVLLGMSFLEKIDMRETSGVLHLYQKY